MKEKIILDVDTGSDDAVAIMLAILSKDIELIGLTTVNGNRNIDITTDNTLRVVDYLNSKVPVYKGCGLPMVSTLLEGRRANIPYQGPEDPEEDVHGATLPLPETKLTEEKEHAVFWLINTLLNSREKLTLVFVGPLTNLGMAIRLEPKIVDKIKEIVIMGGGYTINNVTSGAEFNFWVDPEAAKIVMDCGAPIRLVPLDATHQAYLSIEDCDRIKDNNTPASTFSSDIIKQRIEGYKKFQPMPVPNTAPVHDALAICAIINPNVLRDIINVNVDISISQGITDGMSLLDVEARNRKRKPNVNVALGTNRKIFLEIMKEVLGNKN